MSHGELIAALLLLEELGQDPQDLMSEADAEAIAEAVEDV